MKKSEKVSLLETSYKKIFKALIGLTNAEAIAQLEIAKTDIILNTGSVIIDGKDGKITSKEDKKKSQEWLKNGGVLGNHKNYYVSKKTTTPEPKDN